MPKYICTPNPDRNDMRIPLVKHLRKLAEEMWLREALPFVKGECPAEMDEHIAWHFAEEAAKYGYKVEPVHECTCTDQWAHAYSVQPDPNRGTTIQYAVCHHHRLFWKTGENLFSTGMHRFQWNLEMRDYEQVDWGQLLDKYLP